MFDVVACRPPSPPPFQAKRVAELIRRLKADVRAWATANELSGLLFKVPHEHRGDCFQDSALLLICHDGSLAPCWHDATGALLDGFESLLEAHGCWYEREDDTTIALYPGDQLALAADVMRLQRFDWIQRLATERAFALHLEVFRHFAEHPDDLKRLGWRDFEVVLDQIFQNHGFRTELGPGRADAGVDIRLYQASAISELVTLVQAKRYCTKPITIDTVAAMSGHVAANGAHHGLVVTTSRFLPSAKKWASVKSRRVSIAGPDDVQLWCRAISDGLTAFLERGDLDESPLLNSSAALNGPLVGSILHAAYGYNMKLNSFCRVLAETKYEVVLEPLSSERTSRDGLTGVEVPVCASNGRQGGKRFIAFRRNQAFWGGKKLYRLWDGTPASFDVLD